MDPTDDEITARIQQMAPDGETQPIVDQAPNPDYLNGALQGALAPGPTDLAKEAPTTQLSGGGVIDSRGFLDGSQWTVSTGGGSATGGERTSGDPWGPSIASTSPLSLPPAMQAGMGGMGGTVGLVLFG